MKTVQSRRNDAYSMIVPVQGGYRVNFQDGHATVPDEVAGCLLALGAGFYTVASDSGSTLGAGQSVLIIRDMGLGDVLMTTPLVRHLAQQGVLVDVQTCQRFTPLFDGNPHVRAVKSLEADTVDHTAYAAVLDLRLFVENAEHHQQFQHRVPGFALIADIALPEDAYHLDYFVQPGEADAAREKLSTALPDTSLPDSSLPDSSLPLIAYVWGANSDTRSWGEAQHQTVLSTLLAEDWRIVVLSETPQSLPLTHAQLRDMTGRLSLREACAVISVSGAVVTPDTGLFHIASALDKPVVTYFGAWPITERATHTQLSVVNSPQNCARLPCRSYQCFNREADGQPRCLSVPAPIVVGAVRHQLGLPSSSLVQEKTEANLAEEASPEGNANPVEPIAQADLVSYRAAVFCTAAIDTDPARYQAWADYYSAFFEGADIDLYLFNDGPVHHQISGAVTVVPVGTEMLGRTEGGPFPGWKRSMGAAIAQLGPQYGAIAHVESDLGITPAGKDAFLKSLRTPGFFTGWCPRHLFPETALQVINTETVRAWYTDRYAAREDLWQETFAGECFEHLVQRDLAPVYILNGDRHEGAPPAFDPRWDYLAQCPLTEFQQLYPQPAAGDLVHA